MEFGRLRLRRSILTLQTRPQGNRSAGFHFLRLKRSIKLRRPPAGAFVEWRRTPAVDRVQFLFKLKYLLDENFEELSRTITLENGKTLGESRGEMRRAIENVEVACGIPILMQGYNSEDIAHGIDEIMIRQHIGVAAAICPFNFPGMIPFWFMPYALACGNTYIVKPSEKVPMTMIKVFELLEEVGFPKGVVNLVHGSKDAVMRSWSIQ